MKIIFKWYKFEFGVRQEGYSFEDFIIELKTLVAICSYKEEDNVIRDKIVFGISNADLESCWSEVN